MKEIDFLPEWYKEGKRRRVRMRWQCIALSIIFLAMIAFNSISAHRIACATAELAQLDDQRAHAEDVMHQFGMLSKELTEYRQEMKSLQQMDSRIEPAAVLAEISHIIDEHIVLSRVEFIAESVSPEDKAPKRNRSAVRSAGSVRNATKQAPLGDVRFRILLAGVAATPNNVGELICRLDASRFFRDVHSSGFRDSTIEVPVARAPALAAQGAKKLSAGPKHTLPVSEFEITCYLANYEEIESK